MMGAAERRMEILYRLSERRQDTIMNLAAEFGVSRSTIIRDIDALTTFAPIYTVPGKGGGIRLMANYHAGDRYLSATQTEYLHSLQCGLDAEGQAILQSILDAFERPAV